MGNSEFYVMDIATNQLNISPIYEIRFDPCGNPVSKKTKTEPSKDGCAADIHSNYPDPGTNAGEFDVLYSYQLFTLSVNDLLVEYVLYYKNLIFFKLNMLDIILFAGEKDFRLLEASNLVP